MTKKRPRRKTTRGIFGAARINLVPANHETQKRPHTRLSASHSTATSTVDAMATLKNAQDTMNASVLYKKYGTI